LYQQSYGFDEHGSASYTTLLDELASGHGVSTSLRMIGRRLGYTESHSVWSPDFDLCTLLFEFTVSCSPLSFSLPFLFLLSILS
jgi:hypothetical protein